MTVLDASRIIYVIKLYHSIDPSVQFNELLQRLYDEHCAAFYVKQAMLAQLKTSFRAGIRFSSSQINECIVVGLKQSVVFDQLFESETASLTRLHVKINVRSSIVLTSQILCQLARMTHS
jgi:hypothetical protein